MRSKIEHKNKILIILTTRSENNDHDTITSDEWELKAVIIGIY